MIKPTSLPAGNRRRSSPWCSSCPGSTGHVWPVSSGRSDSVSPVCGTPSQRQLALPLCQPPPVCNTSACKVALLHLSTLILLSLPFPCYLSGNSPLYFCPPLQGGREALCRMDYLLCFHLIYQPNPFILNLTFQPHIPNLTFLLYLAACCHFVYPLGLPHRGGRLGGSPVVKVTGVLPLFGA